MKTTLSLIAAPVVMQPGNYVKAAYADAVNPVTPTVYLEALRSADTWEMTLRWPCPSPAQTCANETDRFVDAIAIMVPAHEQANWITMGSAAAPVEGALWRADRDKLLRMDATGMGTARRSAAPANWRVKTRQVSGARELSLLFPMWENLNRFQRCAVAVWQGDARQRGGLKSVTNAWINLNV